MINYYIRPGGAIVKIDDSSKVIDLVLNIPTQKTLSQIDNIDYYNQTMNLVSGWTVSDQVTYETNKTAVLQVLNN
jgi:hypothetical protein